MSDEDNIPRLFHDEQMNHLRRDLQCVQGSYQHVYKENKSLVRERDLLRKLLELYLEKKDDWK